MKGRECINKECYVIHDNKINTGIILSNKLKFRSEGNEVEESVEYGIDIIGYGVKHFDQSKVFFTKEDIIKGLKDVEVYMEGENE